MKIQFLALVLALQATFVEAKVMNPGETVGQLIYLSASDVLDESPKFKALSPLSIPVFAELPMDLAVVAGAITLKQQNLLSHVQLKSRARKTPNLDISDQPGGLDCEILRPFKDGQYVHMLLKADGTVLIEPSTEAAANADYIRRKAPPVTMVADLSETRILRTDEMTWKDYQKVGAKAANYAELARVLNTPGYTIVPAGFAIPFHFYHQFISQNPNIVLAIRKIMRDPLMSQVADTSYRDAKLKALRDMILSDSSIFDQKMIDGLIELFDRMPSPDGTKRKVKLRSSTNAEDLPNFSGAGLYESSAYKPMSAGVERSRTEKEKSLKTALRIVYASVWNLRAYEERTIFGIKHDEVKMALQVNPAFANEGVNGVVVTRNVAQRPQFPGSGVYVESQRGDKYSVANPETGTHPEQVLVLYDAKEPLNIAKYCLKVFQRSNIADDGVTILAADNPKPVMSDSEMRELVYQSLKATLHFKQILGAENPDFSLDMEFKQDSYDTGKSQLYIKQARPYLE